MAFQHRMQAERRELKYIVSEAVAAGVADFIRSYLVPDEYADPKNCNSYWIHSLYLDNDQYKLARDTLDGVKNRFKLRIRFYDFVETHPVFFEIKSRVNEVILKERAAVHRRSVLKLVRGHFPERSDLVKCDPKSLQTLHRFCMLKDAIQADGKAYVTYLREAYVSAHDDNIRVTFDRRLSAGPYNNSLRWDPLAPFCEANTNSRTSLDPHDWGVVLELKFTDRFPHWMRDLTHTFNLDRSAMAKYVRCVQALERNALLLH